MQATLSDNCGLGTACNYDHTGAFSLTLPGNASFTSDSGVLLTQVAPEPTPTGLFAAGIAVVLFARLRRSRKQVNS